MALIVNLAALYIRNVLSNLKLSILYFLFIAASVYNGFLIAEVIKNVHFANAGRYISVGLFVFTIIRKYFPAFSHFQKPVKASYPVSSVNRYFINLVNDSVLSVNFVALAVFLTAFFSSGHVALNDVLLMLFAVAAGWIVRRTIQCTLFQRITSGHAIIIMVLLAFSIVSCGFVFLYYEKNSLPYYLPLVIIICLATGYLIEEKYSTAAQIKQHENYAFAGMPMQLLFANPKFRLWFFAWTGVKIVFLATISIGFYQKGRYSPLFIIILFASPLTLFNYILNNVFGFFNTYWLSLEKSGPSGKEMFRNLLKLLKWPLMFDILFALIFVAFNRSLMLPVFIVYAGAFPLLVILAFYWSVLFPKTIQTTLFNTKPTAGIVPLVVSSLICSSFVLLSISKWFGAIGILYLFIALLLFSRLNRFYDTERKDLFSNLFKTNP